MADATSVLPVCGHHMPERLEMSVEATKVEGERQQPPPVSPTETKAPSLAAEEAQGASRAEFVLTDQTNFLPKKQVVIIYVALALILGLSFLDTAMLSTALPNISADLKEGEASSWIASAYVLTSAAFQPAIGSWTNIFGRKNIMQGCVGGFVLGSLMCAVAQTMTQLIVFRAFTGIFAGGILTVAFIVLSDIVPLKERGKYQPITEAMIAIMAAIGPIMGGAFSSSKGQGWRWAFWINLPLGFGCMAIIWYFLPLKPVEGNIRQKLLAVDYMGSFLTVAAAVLVMVPLTIGGVNYPWSSSMVIGLFVGGFVGWILLGFWEWKGAKYPMIPIPMIANRTVLSLLFCTLSFGALFAVMMFYLPQLFQLVYGYNAVQSALYILPANFATTVFVVICGQVQSRTGKSKIFVVFGLAMAAVGLGLMSTTTLTSSKGRIIGLSCIVGCAQGFYVQTTLVSIQGAVKREDMASVSATRNFMRMLGTTLGLAIAQTVINASLRSALTNANIPTEYFKLILSDPVAMHSTLRGVLDPAQIDVALLGYVQGFDRVFQISAGWVGASALLVLVFMREVELTRAGEAEDKQKAKEWLAERKRVKREKKEGTTASPV